MAIPYFFLPYFLARRSPSLSKVLSLDVFFFFFLFLRRASQRRVTAGVIIKPAGLGAVQSSVDSHCTVVVVSAVNF